MFIKKIKHELQEVKHLMNKLTFKQDKQGLDIRLLEERVRCLEKKKQLQDELSFTITVTKHSN